MREKNFCQGPPLASPLVTAGQRGLGLRGVAPVARGAVLALEPRQREADQRRLPGR